MIILYKDNPALSLKVVTTVNGEKEYRINCKYIKKEYYRINEDCFYVNNRWYRTNSGFIEFDNEKKIWVLKSEVPLIQGIVAFKNNKPVLGFYSPNPLTNCKVTNSIARDAQDFELLEKNGFFEAISLGTWAPKDSFSASEREDMERIRSIKSFTDKGYNIEDNKDEFEEKKKLFQEYPMEISKGAKIYAKYLGNTSFGMEIESSMGNVPNVHQNRLGLVACRDGSIESAEYVTIPLSGAKGLQNVKNIGEVLPKRINTDYHCSFHVHLGNIPLDRPYVCALYTLFYKIQNDLFNMFPYYKTDPRDYKHKNYCQKLSKLSIFNLKDKSKEGYKAYVEDTFNKIFLFLSDGVTPDEHFNRRDRRHPARQKWLITSRYYALNFVNMFFSKRNTAEFRMHENTCNPQKMVNWLFICNAIVRFAEDNTERILTGEISCTLDNVLNYYKDHFKDENGTFLSEYLKAYYEERVRVFEKDRQNNDFLSEDFTRNDKNYRFTYKGVSDLF